MRHSSSLPRKVSGGSDGGVSLLFPAVATVICPMTRPLDPDDFSPLPGLSIPLIKMNKSED